MSISALLRSTESATARHLDKLADQFSDAILDAYLQTYSIANVACEVHPDYGSVPVGGENTSSACVDIAATIRQVIGDVGYVKQEYGCRRLMSRAVSS